MYSLYIDLIKKINTKLLDLIFHVETSDIKIPESIQTDLKNLSLLYDRIIGLVSVDDKSIFQHDNYINIYDYLITYKNICNNMMYHMNTIYTKSEYYIENIKKSFEELISPTLLTSINIINVKLDELQISILTELKDVDFNNILEIIKNNANYKLFCFIIEYLKEKYPQKNPQIEDLINEKIYSIFGSKKLIITGVSLIHSLCIRHNFIPYNVDKYENIFINIVKHLKLDMDEYVYKKLDDIEHESFIKNILKLKTPTIIFHKHTKNNIIYDINSLISNTYIIENNLKINHKFKGIDKIVINKYNNIYELKNDNNRKTEMIFYNSDLNAEKAIVLEVIENKIRVLTDKYTIPIITKTKFNEIILGVNTLPICINEELYKDINFNTTISKYNDLFSDNHPACVNIIHTALYDNTEFIEKYFKSSKLSFKNIDGFNNFLFNGSIEFFNVIRDTIYNKLLYSTLNTEEVISDGYYAYMSAENIIKTLREEGLSNDTKWIDETKLNNTDYCIEVFITRVKKLVENMKTNPSSEMTKMRNKNLKKMLSNFFS